MEIWRRKIKATKTLKNRIWEALGLHLGSIWEGFGTLWGASGTLLAASGSFFGGLKSSFLNASVQDGLQEAFGIDFGSILGGFGVVLGGSGEDLGQFLEGFGTKSGRYFKDWGRAATESLNWTPALIREASQCAGIPPRRGEP